MSERETKRFSGSWVQNGRMLNSCVHMKEAYYSGNDTEGRDRNGSGAAGEEEVEQV